MSTSLNSERAVVALALLLMASGLFVSTWWLPRSDMGPGFDPAFFPRIVLGCLIALAALNAVIDLRSGSGWSLSGLLGVAGIMALLMIYVVVMPQIGFFAASVVLSVAVLLILEVRSPIPIMVVAVGVPGALVWLFNHVLKMPLPTSPLFWWI